jgi:hypothetical protein
MATMTGTVSCVQLFDDGGFTQIVDPTTQEKEVFILWFAPPEVSAFERILHSMWVSLLREALVNGLTVTITHADAQAQIENVQLGVSQ